MMPDWLEPMAATLTADRFLDPAWTFERKFDGIRVTGVVARRGGETSTIEGGEIILSAGAVNSPHILMRSGVGPADQLRAAGIPVLAELLLSVRQTP